MNRQAAGLFLTLLLLPGCGNEPASRPVDSPPRASLSRDLRDAEALGAEVFELVDRAVDYRGSHRGRPATTFRQMGVDSLTEVTVRRLVNLEREPVITVTFRKPESRDITSCRGDSEILEQAAINGGRFTVMCTTRTGRQLPIRVGRADSDR